MQRGGVHGVPKKKKKIVFAGNVTVCPKNNLGGHGVCKKPSSKPENKCFFGEHGVGPQIRLGHNSLETALKWVLSPESCSPAPGASVGAKTSSRRPFFIGFGSGRI